MLLHKPGGAASDAEVAEVARLGVAVVQLAKKYWPIMQRASMGPQAPAPQIAVSVGATL